MSESQKIQLHPLVQMNIMDHFTRAKYRQDAGTKGYRVLGIILGRQDGRTLEIMNTIEVKFEAKNKNDASVTDIAVDSDFASTRITAYKQMFPDLECVGWYSAKGTTTVDVAGDQPTTEDMAMLRSTSDICDNPIFLIMNQKSQSASDKKKVPLFMYQKGPAGPDGQPSTPFVQLDYSLASEESEQISIDGVANAVDPNAKTSALQQRMAAPINAIKILRSKLNFLITAVKQSPEVRQNRGFMRRLNQIVAVTTITNSEAYDSQFFGEYSDSAAMNMLTTVTQSCQQIQQLIDDFKVIDKSKAGSNMVNIEERMDIGRGFPGSGGNRQGLGMMRKMNPRAFRR